MSIIDILNIDVIICIFDYLKDYDKMNFMMTCKEYYCLRNDVKYTNLYEYNIIEKLSFNNKFKRLVYRGQIPNTNVSIVKHIEEFLVKDLDKLVPNNVTHLTFGQDFNQNINGYIPNTITNLTFGFRFNKSIKNCIPDSVTNLTFGSNFNQNIKDCIPNSVTNLTFGWDFNQDIKNCIPNTITNLTFGYYFNKSIKNCIPDSVTHLTFGVHLKKY
nr:F-box and FNIP repeat domain containing protein [Mimivirus sp.]